MIGTLNARLRKYGMLHYLAGMVPCEPVCETDGKKGIKRIVTVDVTTMTGAKIWVITSDGTLSELTRTRIGKPKNGKIPIEVADGEEVFLAKSLAEAVKMISKM